MGAQVRKIELPDQSALLARHAPGDFLDCYNVTSDMPVRQAADKNGIFPVEAETPAEVIAGFDDKHLNFRVSVLAYDSQISLATWVAPHNIGGRIYLAAIMPFHIAVARNALARIARA